MTYLVDTTVVSELRRPRPNVGLQAWMQQHDAQCAISALSLGEIRYGISRLNDEQKRALLERWWDTTFFPWCGDRVLAVDTAIGLRWGVLTGEAARRGRTLPAVDSLIGATAAVHGLTVVTRNVRHFEDCGVPVLNPWEPQPPTH